MSICQLSPSSSPATSSNDHHHYHHQPPPPSSTSYIGSIQTNLCRMTTIVNTNSNNKPPPPQPPPRTSKLGTQSKPLNSQFVVPIEPEIVPLQSSSSIQPQSLQHDQSSTPDESVGSTPSGSHTPPVQRWVRSFDNLISDHDGVNSFKRFLSEENANPNTVDFYFLCKSVPLPENDTDRPQLVRAIYRNYLLHSSKNTILPFLSKEVKDELMTEYVKIQQHKQQDPTNQSSPIEPPNYTEVFKRAQDEIYNIMSGAFYQNFLRSRTYMEKFTYVFLMWFVFFL